nr:RHS repeat-associated core domain-containing protein [Dysgonomonas sp. BGC7]
MGMEFAENSGESDQPYKYNGKELDKMHGLNMYDYSARYYEPAIGRFITVDPHAENYYSWSPYSFVLGNPIRNIDPLGMDVWTTNDPAEIERVLSSLKSGETVDSNKFGDQWTRVENVSENDYAIFDDHTSDFTIGGVPYKDFTGYGKKGVGFDLLIDLMGLGLTKKGGTLTLFMQQSMDKNKFIRASYYSIVYSGQAMSNKISLSKTRLNLGSLGKGLGYLGGVGLGVTTVNDIYGVYTNTITLERAVSNFSMGEQL